MHISEGILSAPVLLSSAALAAAGTAIGLKKLDYEKIPLTGILSAAFFVASLIHLPLGPGSVHLVLNGIVGLMLGWCAFPAILIALVLQAVFFQFGGFTTLGVNTLIMAFPAVICWYLFSPLIAGSRRIVIAAAFACGSVSVLLSALIMAGALIFTEENFIAVAYLVVGWNLPVMLIEGMVTVFCILFFQKVQPGLISSPRSTS